MVAPKLIPLLNSATLAGPTVLPHCLLGFFVALAIAGAAYWAGALSRSGAFAAVAIGTVTVAAGWGWGMLLITYFALSSLLSRYKAAQKERRTGAIVEKGGRRDATQVLANGGIFATAACAAIALPSPFWQWAALGALAASASDTWATEIGTLYGGDPTAIISRTNVRSGTSGGVTVIGSMGGIAGAVITGIVAWLAGWNPGSLGATSLEPHESWYGGLAFTALVALIAGTIGMLADSIVGETLQEQRWCAQCNTFTERRVHDCQTPTRHAKGIAWIGNDLVNAIATAVGACVGLFGAAWIARLT